jgi:hypothetical protein
MDEDIHVPGVLGGAVVLDIEPLDLAGEPAGQTADASNLVTLAMPERPARMLDQASATELPTGLINPSP